ncbi:MAG: crossover junction endodeoxyribonuclease RuvC [Patescibacteria group bacterium]
MKILGIDPGIGRCGWAVVETRSSKLEARNYGCIETSAEQETGERLKDIYETLSRLAKQYKPDIMAIEDLFFSKNVKTAMVVGQARGVILLVAAQFHLPLFTYTPLQVKVAVTGYGRAEKSQMGKMVKMILKLKVIPTPDDTVDALATAITHAFTKKSYGEKRV